MSFSKELVADNSLDSCDLAVSSILQIDEADLLYGDSLLNQLDEFTLTETTLNPSGSTNEEDSIPENSKLVENDSNKSRGRKRKTKQIKRKEIETKVRKCQECSTEFAKQSTLVRHLHIHSEERNYLCEVCGKAFRQQSTLYQHRTLHTMAKPHTCPVCNKSFSRASTLVSHRKIHDGEKSHQCPHCPQAFHHKGNLRHHIYTHTNERPYKCDFCSKGFKQSSNLARHKLKTHGSVQRYECQICGKSFMIRAHCQKHELNDHADRMEEPHSESTTDNTSMADGDHDDIPNLPANTMKIVIDSTNAEAMRVARALNQQPLLVDLI